MACRPRAVVGRAGTEPGMRLRPHHLVARPILAADPVCEPAPGSGSGHQRAWAPPMPSAPSGFSKSSPAGRTADRRSNGGPGCPRRALGRGSRSRNARAGRSGSRSAQPGPAHRAGRMGEPEFCWCGLQATAGVLAPEPARRRAL